MLVPLKISACSPPPPPPLRSPTKKSRFKLKWESFDETRKLFLKTLLRQILNPYKTKDKLIHLFFLRHTLSVTFWNLTWPLIREIMFNLFEISLTWHFSWVKYRKISLTSLGYIVAGLFPRLITICISLMIRLALAPTRVVAFRWVCPTFPPLPPPQKKSKKKKKKKGGPGKITLQF